MAEKTEIRELLLEKAKISFYEKGYQKLLLNIWPMSAVSQNQQSHIILKTRLI